MVVDRLDDDGRVFLGWAGRVRHTTRTGMSTRQCRIFNTCSAGGTKTTSSTTVAYSLGVPGNYY